MGLVQTGTLASQVRNVCPHSFAPERPPSCILAPNSAREGFLPILQPAGLQKWNVLLRWGRRGCVCVKEGLLAQIKEDSEEMRASL